MEDFDTFEYETLQDEIAIEMMSEAIREEWQMNGYDSEYDEQDEDCYWEEDSYDR